MKLKLYQNNLIQILIIVLFVIVATISIAKWNTWTWQYIFLGIVFCLLWRNWIFALISNLVATAVAILFWHVLITTHMSPSTIQDIRGFQPIIEFNLIFVYVAECALVIVRNYLLRMIFKSRTEMAE